MKGCTGRSAVSNSSDRISSQYCFERFTSLSPDTPLLHKLALGVMRTDIFAQELSIPDEVREFRESPDPKEIIGHALCQLEKAHESGIAKDDAHEWDALLKYISGAISALEHSDIVKACFYFYLLGAQGEHLAAPYGQEANKKSKYEYEGRKRLEPIERRNAQIHVTREVIQDLAARFWEDDQAQTIRVQEMANRIWSYLRESGILPSFAKELLPSSAEGLVSWVRPVAPDYAKKGGRPRKKP